MDDPEESEDRIVQINSEDPIMEDRNVSNAIYPGHGDLEEMLA